MILVPHFSASFTMNRTATVVEQNSPEDYVARAKNVLVCEQGFRDDTPEFGIPPILFQPVPPNINAIRDAVTRWAAINASVSEQIIGLVPSSREVTVQVGP